MKKYSTSLEAPILSNNTEIDWEGQSWKDRVFSHPERTVRIATAFSGIGSPEQALNKLGLKHEIVFACDIDKPAKKSPTSSFLAAVEGKERGSDAYNAAMDDWAANFLNS